MGFKPGKGWPADEQDDEDYRRQHAEEPALPSSSVKVTRDAAIEQIETVGESLLASSCVPRDAEWFRETLRQALLALDNDGDKGGEVVNLDRLFGLTGRKSA